MGFKHWDKIAIRTDDGTTREGIAPLIISASRSTDIPAFHAAWLLERLRRGYVRWVNPFNRASQYVSFEQARLFVFWSKNPKPLIPGLAEFDRRGLNYYFQYTVNDYEAEKLEPHVPPLGERLRTFRDLAARLGRGRVIWRFDPLILAGDMTVGGLLEKIRRVGGQLAGSTEKLVISFADISEYAKVRSQLKRAQQAWRDFTATEKDELAGRIAGLAGEWGLEVTTCAEDFDLSAHGIARNRCIDNALIARLFPHDEALMDFLGLAKAAPKQGALFASAAAPGQTDRDGGFSALKDKGQRKACGCIVSKDIGQYNTCAHLCLYCYANTSAGEVRKNLGRTDLSSDAITAWPGCANP